MNEYGLHTGVGSMAQLQVAAQRIVYSGLSQRYPDIEFIFAVCGGISALCVGTRARATWCAH